MWSGSKQLDYDPNTNESRRPSISTNGSNVSKSAGQLISEMMHC